MVARLEPRSPAAISVRDLTKRYGRIHAVRGVSFDVPWGTVTGFLGPNGAGKTTSMRAVLGLVRPTSGTALVAGEPSISLRRRGIAVAAEAEGALVVVPDSTPDVVGAIAAEDGIVLHGLEAHHESLEDLFLELTGAHSPDGPKEARP